MEARCLLELKNSKKLKKERVAKRKESRRITKNYDKTIQLRLKAKEELKILVELSSSVNDSELEVYNEIKFHLEASQKGLTYFGFRGIAIGIVVLIVTNVITTKGVPIIFNISEQIDDFSSFLEKSLIFALLIAVVMVITLISMFILHQVTLPFRQSEKEIREQIYINEYMLKIVEEKIKDI